MTPTAERLYNLLPAIYRVRDDAQGGPLKALIGVIAEQVAVIEDDLAQLYDDQFIETCAPWVAPYLGDLIGYRALHGVVPRVSSPRAEIANTIGYRRRKGTAAMLEQMARDVTGWDACVVEYFQRLATTQHLNHVRPGNRSPDLRTWEPLERMNGPFDRLPHTADVRRIAVGRGRHNIPNVGIFLWRLNSYPLTDVQPLRIDERRYCFHPLGADQPLFTRPQSRDERSGLSTRMNVPDPIGRRTFAEFPTDYYGEGKSLLLRVDGAVVAVEEIESADLSDSAGGSWRRGAGAKVCIDPVLGRIAFPAQRPAPQDVRVSYHYGFSAELGGGGYDRNHSVPEAFTEPTAWQIGVSAQRPPIPGERVTTLLDAIIAWNDQPAGTVGVISIMDSATYDGALEVVLREGSELLVVAADWPEVIQPEVGLRGIPGRFSAAGGRPCLRGEIAVRGEGSKGGKLCLNGLLIEGPLHVAAGPFAALSLQHCTLVPGGGFSREGYPAAPREPTLTVSAPAGVVQLDHAITGGIRVTDGVTVSITDSLVDATSRCGVALAAGDGHGPAGRLTVANSTVIGKVHAELMELATNTIFFARLAVHDAWPAPVWCTRQQEGCVRFCFVPLNSRTPRRYECQPRNPLDAARVLPLFSSLRYGEPGYGQLSERCAPEIFHGADDESAMGAGHELFEPQRIANVGVRLEEYLRFGLEAGLFFEPHLASRPIVPGPYAYTKWVDLCDDAAADALPGIGAGLI